MSSLQTVFKTPTQLRVACFVLAFLLLAATIHVLRAEGLRYARWASGEAFHPASFADGERVILFAMAAGGLLLLLGVSAADWLVDRVFPIAEETPDPPPTFCPLAVIELVSVPPGQEQNVRKLNHDLFTLEEARRMLALYKPVAQDEFRNLEMLLGVDALYERQRGYLVRLGRRGFHGG